MLHLPKALNRVFAVAVVFVVLVMAAACPQPTPQVGEKVVTQVVEKQVVEPTDRSGGNRYPRFPGFETQTAIRAHDSWNETPVAAPRSAIGFQNEAIQRELNEEMSRRRPAVIRIPLSDSPSLSGPYYPAETRVMWC